MASQRSLNAVYDLFDLLSLPRPSAARAQRLANELDTGQRTLAQMRDALIQFIANEQGVSFDSALAYVIRRIFERHGVPIATSKETQQQRIARLVQEVKRGRSLHDIRAQVRQFAAEQSRSPSRATSSGSTTKPTPATPEPTPDPATDPDPKPVDWLEQARTLFPWMPEPLLKVFADAWAETGDTEVALARMRQSPQYDRYFAGNRRPDGTFRMTEAEYMSTIRAYRTLLSDFGLNPDLFQKRFVSLIEGEVSPLELRERLGAAYEGIIANIPQVREFYARYGYDLSDAAIFASVIDPEIGDAILARRIAVAQVGGEGLARGFDVDLSFAERLADAGLSQQEARGFFARAEAELPTLETLARRHYDPDDTFDLGEFAELAVFGDSEQARRVRRLIDAEIALFSERLGSIAADDFRLTGLRAR